MPCHIHRTGKACKDVNCPEGFMKKQYRQQYNHSARWNQGQSKQLFSEEFGNNPKNDVVIRQQNENSDNHDIINPRFQYEEYKMCWQLEHWIERKTLSSPKVQLPKHGCLFNGNCSYPIIVKMDVLRRLCWLRYFLRYDKCFISRRIQSVRWYNNSQK